MTEPTESADTTTDPDPLIEPVPGSPEPDHNFRRRLRHGDTIFVEASVYESRNHRAGTLFVEFRNGDSLPLSSVLIGKIKQYGIRVGDRILNPSLNSLNSSRATVLAVHADLGTPQVTYIVDGEWMTKTASLKNIVRSDPEESKP